MTSPTRAEAVAITRELPLAADAVFDWLTDPVKLARWMSPQGEVIAEADARPGGRLRIVMFDGSSRIEHTGKFLEVSSPRRLVFTWNSPYTDGESLVTIELEARGSRTELSLTHERLPERHAEAHVGGWTQIVDRLAREIAGEYRP